MTLAARIEGIGMVGPGFASWSEARAMLASAGGYAPQPTVIPAPEALPATERRRAGKNVKLALAAGLEAARAAGREPAQLTTVFASSGGDGDNCHAICAALASDDRLISPTRFHNSVHNAPAGYWSIATGATHAADCIAAFDASFGAGLLEALARIATEPGCPVLLIAYDAPYPEPLYATRPVPDALAVALVLSAANGSGPTLRAQLAQDAPSTLDDPGLEWLRASIPAARALPLLQLLARERAGTAALEYLEGCTLRAEVTA